MKNIVLCSDGTGNKGGYGADSNVYKTYKAVDVRSPNVHQYTFYDQGVGTDKSDTSKNKYTTALSGAFGFGFRDNVLHLYHFLARCYVPGDAIFLFGFSRGAATVRAFADFVNACGLIEINHAKVNGVFDSDKFQSLVNQAFDCYRNQDTTAQQNFKNCYAFHDATHAPNGNLKIKFVGVWDTVSALGFSKDFSIVLKIIFTAAEKVVNMIPFLAYDFYGYELNNSIENAYHALSIDDERKTFHPLVWDESGFGNHVEQVWFAGVHSNVGGGYPRTGLSDMALLWMLNKAAAHGLVLYPDHIAMIQESANVYDKLYDSRDGVAIYYRYDPRNLVELCKNKLKGRIAIHISAYRKIKQFSEGYAPDGIPANFDVVDIDKAAPAKSALVLQVNAAQPDWMNFETEANEMITARKYLYRYFVELTMTILVVAGIFWRNPPDSMAALNSCEIEQVQLVQPPLPSSQSLVAAPIFTYQQAINSIPVANTLPDFCAKANDRPLKWLGDILRYLMPVYFKNFITYVLEVHWWILAVMLATLYGLNLLRKRFINNLDSICRRMSDLL